MKVMLFGKISTFAFGALSRGSSRRIGGFSGRRVAYERAEIKRKGVRRCILLQGVAAV